MQDLPEDVMDIIRSFLTAPEVRRLHPKHADYYIKRWLGIRIQHLYGIHPRVMYLHGFQITPVCLETMVESNLIQNHRQCFFYIDMCEAESLKDAIQGNPVGEMLVRNGFRMNMASKTLVNFVKTLGRKLSDVRNVSILDEPLSRSVFGYLIRPDVLSEEEISYFTKW